MRVASVVPQRSDIMAKRAEDLECWRLADQLRTEVVAICDQPAVSKHGRFCDGFTEAAGSVCRNIREGFGRFTSASIVQFFDYAIASLEEVEDYLHESRTRKFIDADRFNRSMDLAEHTRATTLKFKRFHEGRLPPPRPPRSATRRMGK